MAAVVKAADADFDQKVMKSALPVLVDFYGTWCTPCQQLKPVLEEIAREYDGRLAVVEVEVSEAPEATASLDVLGVPTLVLVSGGRARDTLSGSPSKADIVRAIRALVP